MKKEFLYMLRKILLPLGFFLISLTAFADDLQLFKAGDYTIMAVFERGETSGSVFRRMSGQGQLTDSKPSRQQMEWVRNALNSFETKRGDVYSIGISRMADLADGYMDICICEFTSDSNFNYWFYLYHNR
jgi:hypothetical protein